MRTSCSDDARSYGWISIGLHWLTTPLILALWYLGDSIASMPPGLGDRRLQLHMAIAVLAYLPLWARIVWRLRWGHPAAAQPRSLPALARIVHYGLVLAIATMLVSGPLMVWSAGAPVHVFDVAQLPSPLGTAPDLASFCRRVHETCGAVLIALAGLHIAGGIRHMMSDGDATALRIFRPARYPGSGPAGA